MIETIYSNPDFLAHYGVKGMRWGVRNEDNYDASKSTLSRREKKELERFRRDVEFGGQAGAIVTINTIATLDKKDYAKATKQLSEGSMYTNAQFLPNYKNKSIDVFVGNSDTSIMSLVKKGKNQMEYQWSDPKYAKNAQAFLKYRESH